LKWFISGNDVSRELLQFREICKEEGAKGQKLQSDIDKLALNSIFFISSKHSKYTGISEDTYKVMIEELEEKYDVGGEVDLDELDQFQVEKLRRIYKVTISNIIISVVNYG
ncbi:hypothetical protein BDF20DRAFT_826263, partial [Mycotypha africana]|uniref:uncharacterized protein n=1 Tax=Mycotypha africana TaxID=64632 RepID=UPI0022FFF250